MSSIHAVPLGGEPSWSVVSLYRGRLYEPLPPPPRPLQRLLSWYRPPPLPPPRPSRPPPVSGVYGSLLFLLLVLQIEEYQQ